MGSGESPMVTRPVLADNLGMDAFATEIATRFVSVFLRPTSLVVYTVVPLALTTGLGNSIYMRFEEWLARRAEPTARRDRYPA